MKGVESRYALNHTREDGGKNGALRMSAQQILDAAQMSEHQMTCDPVTQLQPRQLALVKRVQQDVKDGRPTIYGQSWLKRVIPEINKYTSGMVLGSWIPNEIYTALSPNLRSIVDNGGLPVDYRGNI